MTPSEFTGLKLIMVDQMEFGLGCGSSCQWDGGGGVVVGAKLCGRCGDGGVVPSTTSFLGLGQLKVRFGPAKG